MKLAYWAARGSQEIRDVLKTTVDNFQKIIDYHSAQLSVGAIAEQDLLRVRLEGERLKISADLAFIEANRARMELLKEMGQTDFAEVVLTEPLALDSSGHAAGRRAGAGAANRNQGRARGAGTGQGECEASRRIRPSRSECHLRL